MEYREKCISREKKNEFHIKQQTVGIFEGIYSIVPALLIMRR